MKFSFKCLGNRKIRRGILSDFPRLPEVSIETPLLLLTTKGGSIPHTTHEVFQMLTQEHQSIQIGLPSTIQCYDGVKEYNRGIATFVGLQECLTYCSVQDSAVETPAGYNIKNNISIWSNSGKVSLDANRYMNIMEAFKPDMYQALCNGDTNQASSQKKCRKAVSATECLLKECLARHKESQDLRTSSIFGVVEGGFDLEARKLSAKCLAEEAVDGFVFDGFHNNGTTIDSIDFNEVKPLIEESLKYLPEDKLRIIHGSWKPANVLELIELGIDVFDSSLAYLATERYSALVFRYEYAPLDSPQGTCSALKLDISLKDDKYKEDFSPILEGCCCLSCQKHTRAYIHHLIMNKELLASTLLMLHNLHHYIEFFKCIRSTPQDKRITLL